jgi:signal transduction histidine kinase
LLLKTARQNLRAAAEAKGLDLGVVLAADVPELVNGDYNLVQRLLTILGGNAVKFTERGHITLAAEKQSQTDHQLWLLFSVSDTGIGIPEENREALFRDFTQIDGSLTRRHGGVGLGLTMARRLVDLLGGRMGVEANPEGGTTFHFSLPFQPTEEVLPE